jgi:hypothetical protein
MIWVVWELGEEHARENVRPERRECHHQGDRPEMEVSTCSVSFVY